MGGIRGGGHFKQVDEFEEEYPEDDDDMYEFDFDPDDAVLPSHESASERRAALRKQLEQELGRVEFSAAYKILLDRYRRMEREQDVPNDNEKVVQATMRKVSGGGVFGVFGVFGGSLGVVC